MFFFDWSFTLSPCMLALTSLLYICMIKAKCSVGVQYCCSWWIVVMKTLNFGQLRELKINPDLKPNLIRVTHAQETGSRNLHRCMWQKLCSLIGRFSSKNFWYQIQLRSIWCKLLVREICACVTPITSQLFLFCCDSSFFTIVMPLFTVLGHICCTCCK